jgi:hypothetical protein
MEDYLTLNEAVEFFGKPLPTIRALIYYDKKVPSYLVDKKRLIKKEDLENYFKGTFKEPITDEITKIWYDRFMEGESIKSLSKEFNRDVQTISKILHNKYLFNTKDYHVRLSKEERKILLEMQDYYMSDPKISLLETIKTFNYTNIGKFTNYLRRNGIKIKSFSDIKSYVENPDFFSVIDSEIKAYLLGFFAADGHIETTGALKVGVSIKDSHIVTLFNKVLCNSKCSLNCKNGMVTFACKHPNIRRDLHAMGFDNNKTYSWKKLPELDSKIMPHFLRGFFDGDGSISVDRRIQGSKLSGYNKHFSIACYNKEILEQIVEILQISKYKIHYRENTDFLIKGHLIKKASGFNLSVNDTEELNKIYNYLYSDATFFFKRKKDKFSLTILSTELINAALQGNL